MIYWFLGTRGGVYPSPSLQCNPKIQRSKDPRSKDPKIQRSKDQRIRIYKDPKIQGSKDPKSWERLTSGGKYEIWEDPHAKYQFRSQNYHYMRFQARQGGMFTHSIRGNIPKAAQNRPFGLILASFWLPECINPHIENFKKRNENAPTMTSKLH